MRAILRRILLRNRRTDLRRGCEVLPVRVEQILEREGKRACAATARVISASGSTTCRSLQRRSPAARTAESGEACTRPTQYGRKRRPHVSGALSRCGGIHSLDRLLAFPVTEMAATLRHIVEALKGPAFEEVRAQVEPLFFLPTDDAAVGRDMTAVFAKTPQHVLHVGLGSRHFSPVLVPNQINAVIE